METLEDDSCKGKLIRLSMLRWQVCAEYVSGVLSSLFFLFLVVFSSSKCT